MSTNWLSEEYANRIEEFIKFITFQHIANRNELVRCPCVRYCYVKRMKTKEIKDHLFVYLFMALINSIHDRFWHNESELSHISSNYEDKGRY